MHAQRVNMGMQTVLGGYCTANVKINIPVASSGRTYFIQEKNCSCSQYHIYCVYVYEFVHIEGIHFNVFLHLKFSVVFFLNRRHFGLGLQQEVSG